ncbi:uncharacterized protein BX663DRAFT_428023 [Cokeromyces recurvatus]|uniref:uncharacterized protein n=1 Tax=Cokeromyces recurvatus TaxID=90255 RepID=UPI00221EFD11|nr:uncharacterized protein BX663DRAFT_428023 [Cokeromyces recurvatus]KAI7906576.1 hypothetical protein BX663DRAFT_428023 [Cokeromyces recurvatus]
MSVKSPVMIITGASKGIGKAATLEALTSYNARVVAIARSSALLEELQKHVSNELNKPGQLEIVIGDVTDDRVIHKAVNTAIDKWGCLDSVIANAGVLEPIASIAEAPIEGWKKLFDINVFSVISLVQNALPYLRKSERGSIIVVSSGAALKGYKGWGAYGASKATINHIATTLSVEEPNVTTIALRPGVVDTEMQNVIRTKGKESMKEDHDKFIDLHRSGKLVKPQDPGHVLAALANNPPKELSGKMYSWNDEEMKPFCRRQ